MAHSARRLRPKFAAPSLSWSCLHKLLAAAHGVGEGWSVVLRRERRGVATVAAFDPACCLARLCTPRPGVMFKNRPRFIKLLQPDDLEKMRVPDKFVQEHLTETESCPSSQTAIILSPLSKFWRVELERGQSDVLFKGGWARFLMAHDLSQGNILVFRYEGNMVFSVEVFLQNGCLKEYTRAGALILTDDPNGPRTGTPQSGNELVVATASKKRKYTKRVVSPNSANKVGSQCKLANTLRKPSFKKQINRYSLKSFLAVKRTFCSSIGLVSACTIKLQTSMDSTRSWSVPFNTANTYGYITGPRWKRFCRDNKLKEGDLCTFNIVKTTVWHVVIN
ncbi:hypothetical protein BRADI_1g35588v3 [Brachypodium distachyon]|uniref:TF-B3 domain-containing protein n=1 Tax=Brachypodium distachyon TaxID=15368 RepID=A0A2K2DMV4_BRADI|nr:hypothetical protein BRADI_1g35588v3 [Brachypodium distachyon]